MIAIPSNWRVWLASGHTDMRHGMNGLAPQVQEGLQRDPHVGDLFVFRGKRGDLGSFHAALTASKRTMRYRQSASFSRTQPR